MAEINTCVAMSINIQNGFAKRALCSWDNPSTRIVWLQLLLTVDVCRGDLGLLQY